MNDPSIYETMVFDVPVSLEDTRQWFTRTVLNPQRKDFVFSHTTDADETLLAMGGLTGIDTRHRHAEFYIFVKPGAAGRGIGRATVQWLCNFGFLHLDLQRIYLETHQENVRARHLYARLGFVLEGTLRQHTWIQGTFHDRCVMGLLRDDWLAQAWAITAIDQFSLQEATACR